MTPVQQFFTLRFLSVRVSLKTGSNLKWAPIPPATLAYSSRQRVPIPPTKWTLAVNNHRVLWHRRWAPIPPAPKPACWSDSCKPGRSVGTNPTDYVSLAVGTDSTDSFQRREATISSVAMTQEAHAAEFATIRGYQSHGRSRR